MMILTMQTFFLNIKTTPDLKPDSPDGIFYKSIVYFSSYPSWKEPIGNIWESETSLKNQPGAPFTFWTKPRPLPQILYPERMLIGLFITQLTSFRWRFYPMDLWDFSSLWITAIQLGNRILPQLCLSCFVAWTWQRVTTRGLYFTSQPCKINK